MELQVIKGMVIAAKLANKFMGGALENNRAEIQIGDVNLVIYSAGGNEVVISPTSMEMWYDPIHVEGTVEGVFDAIGEMLKEAVEDDEDSPYRYEFPNLECLVEYIEKETGVVANEHPKCYTKEWDGIMEFDEFKIVFFGPYHGTVYVPEDYKLNFVLKELP